MSSLSRVHCRDLLDVLRFLPSNASKRFPKLSPRQASERAREVSGIATISVANANSIMSNLSTFLNWAVNEEMLMRNPARGLRMPDQVAKRDKRLPFSPEQLRIIFDAPLYRGCLDGERGYAKQGNQRPRNARFWVPLIALFTGARLGEICQLDVADVCRVDGIDCFAITQATLVGSTDKRLKTGASERSIPIHPVLIRCGLLHFVNEKRRDGETKMFGDIESGKIVLVRLRSPSGSRSFYEPAEQHANAPASTHSGTTSAMSFALRRSNTILLCCSEDGRLALVEPVSRKTTAAAIGFLR